MDSRLSVVCENLEFPEGGPICLPDGSVLVVEIHRQTLTQCFLDGSTRVVAKLGGGPNSSAVGPDGNIYITNNGGFEYLTIQSRAGTKVLLPHGTPSWYEGGSIQKVDTTSGEVATLYTYAVGKGGEKVKLCGPNDLVFDAAGGFYFTDLGKTRAREKDRTGVFYATVDGSRCDEVIFPMEEPNGCALSPDGKELYVAETATGRVFKFRILSPGKIDPKDARGTLIYSSPERYQFDSMAVDSQGNVCVATLGQGKLGQGGITVIHPGGSGMVDFVPTGDPLTTNIAFGGHNHQDAFITLGGTGKLVKMRWHVPGLRCKYEDLLGNKPLLAKNKL